MIVIEDFENWHCFQTYPFPDDNYDGYCFQTYLFPDYNYDEFYKKFCGFL
jgi:hypothetical protein